MSNYLKETYSNHFKQGCRNCGIKDARSLDGFNYPICSDCFGLSFNRKFHSELLDIKNRWNRKAYLKIN